MTRFQSAPFRWSIAAYTLLSVCAAILIAREPAEPTVEFPAALTKFKPYQANPVFTGAGENHWDAKIRERGWILRDGNLWHLWYTGYDGTREGVKHLGHASSEDGLHWTRDRRNPLDAENWIEDMTIVRRGGTYYMFAEGRGDQAHWFTSQDGLKWTRQGTIDIRLTNGEPIPTGPYGTPTVWFDNNRWHLMYERGDKGIWLATSKDLKTWYNVQDEPVIKIGPEEYDKEMIAVNQVIKIEGKYYCIYHGSGTPTAPRTWTTNLAGSTDGIHWKKYSGNPIVTGNRSSGIVVPEKWNAKEADETQSNFDFPKSARFRLYTMHDQVEAFLPAD
jgi:beta-1,2-mannobiose phosphorylase / 1,2-beta-oligomannan phosphorylase